MESYNARRRRMRIAEEERMTNYSPADREGDWEYKIVRSPIAAFGRRENLDKLIAEEARSGWSMVEKFDNARVRFKRPASAKAHDANLPPGVDPYRSYYGMTPLAFGLVFVAIILGGSIVLFSAIGIAVFLILQG